MEMLLLQGVATTAVVRDALSQSIARIAQFAFQTMWPEVLEHESDVDESRIEA